MVSYLLLYNKYGVVARRTFFVDFLLTCVNLYDIIYTSYSNHYESGSRDYDRTGISDKCIKVARRAVADAPKKQIPLRLSKSLYDELSVWAEEDFRSLNGQIEYLLTQCVRQHRQNGASGETDPPIQPM